MTEDRKTDTLPPDTEPAPPPAREDSEAAPTVFVRGGGTGTSKSEQLFEQRFQEAEVRRDIAAEEKRLAADQQTLTHPETGDPMNMPGHMGGAVQYTNQLTAHPELPVGYVHLIYESARGEPTGVECLADLFAGASEDPNELCLVLVCPRCQQRSHKHQQDNQIRIFQRNKDFVFEPGAGDPIIHFGDEVHRRAGIIRHCPKFECPDCTWRAVIEDDRVRPA